MVLPDDVPDVEPLAVRLLVLAYLLTRFFHLVRASGHVASARWDDDEAILEAGLQDRIGREIVEPAIQVLVHLKRDLADQHHDTENVSEAVIALLGRVQENLASPNCARRPTLNVDHLRLITEVAWYYLGRRNSIYPGWTELLLRLMLREGRRATTTSGRPRPRHTQIAELPDAVAELLRPPTRSSWHAGAVESDRDELYAAIADLLCAQADALDAQAIELTRDGRAANLPPAAAFVTSFDLELDMALWRLRGSKQFSVVLPVHVLRDKDTREADFCWLHGTITPVADVSDDAGLELLQTPQSWSLLTPQTGTDLLRARPTVIHLSGCPLFALPDLSHPSSEDLVEDLAAVGVSLDRSEAEMTHAVTVDEYLALRQSEAELFWTASGDGTGASKSRALHPSFTRDGDDNPRYWMALGVPMADPAVRNRVASQITLRWIRDSAHRAHMSAAGEQHLGPDPALGTVAPEYHSDVGRMTPVRYRADVDGVAVNKRLSDDEVGLLNWLGLDVVDAECAEFTRDLVHYTRHVRHDRKRPRLDLPCRLDEPGPPA